MNAFELKNKLNGMAEEVCRHLLPHGKLEHGKYCVGDVAGNPGKSLKVHVSGARVGLWCDFASSDAKGSLLDLWMHVRGVNLPTSISEIHTWLGVPQSSGSKVWNGRQVKYTKPSKEGIVRISSDSRALRYLRDERKIEPEVISRYVCSQTKEDKTLVFPFFSGSECVMIKFMDLDRLEGKKKIWSSANCPKVLFGKNAVDLTKPHLIICEGEIDAMSWASHGFNAVSVPFGAKSGKDEASDPNMEWIANDWDWLDQFPQIHLCFDNDEPGKLAAESIAHRIGLERCMIVALPEVYKDANEAHLNKANLAEFFLAAEEKRPAALLSASDYADKVWSRLHQPDGGLQFPFEFELKIRPGEVTIWTGYSGSGKTTFLSMLLIHLLNSDGQKACIASLEVPPATTMADMTIQAMGAYPRPDQKSEFDLAYGMLAEKIWLIDHVGTIRWQELIDIMRYSVKRYGCTQVVVDSLLRCGIAEDNHDDQLKFVEALCLLAKVDGCHVHLVAHSRKGAFTDESKPPGKLDVRGSAAITDQCFNGATIWRNKEKYRVLMDEDATETAKQKAALDADGKIIVWKQRSTGEEPSRRLWFVRGSRQYFDHQRATGACMV